MIIRTRMGACVLIAAAGALLASATATGSAAVAITINTTTHTVTTTKFAAAELEVDVDSFSGSNNTAIDLPQPAGGWKANITEAEFLCFYDTTTWPLSHRQPGKAVTLPAGCGA